MRERERTSVYSESALRKVQTVETYFCQIVCCLLHCHVSSALQLKRVKPEHSITVAASPIAGEARGERAGGRRGRGGEGEGLTVGERERVRE